MVATRDGSGESGNFLYPVCTFVIFLVLGPAFQYSFQQPEKRYIFNVMVD